MKTRAEALVEEAAHHLEFAAIALRRAQAEGQFEKYTAVGLGIVAKTLDNHAVSARKLAKGQ